MCQWMQPLFKSVMADQPIWGLRDILKEKPEQE